jgi:hypothetical protein
MNRLLLFALSVFVCSVFVSAQLDPWHHPLNWKGQSYGVTYGTVLPTVANTGSPPTDGLLAIVLDPGTSNPSFRMYSQALSGWMENLSSGVPLSGTSGAILDITETINVMSAGDVVDGLLLDYENADHTGGEFNGLRIDAITQDADAIESAIRVETGWDRVLDFATSASIYVQDVYVGLWNNNFNSNKLTIYGTADSNGGGGLRIATAWDNLDGGDDTHGVYVDIANGNHTGVGNRVSALRVDGIVGDAQADEVLLTLGDGFDYLIDDETNTALGTLTWTTNADKTANAKSGTLKVFVDGTLYHIQLYADS